MDGRRSLTSSSSSSGEEQIPLFRCKKCDGYGTFTAAEKDAHRVWHQANDKKKEVPKRNLRSFPTRASPAPSSVSGMFEPVASGSRPRPTVPAPSTSKKATAAAPKMKTRRSNKKHDTNVMGKWSRGISG